MNINIPDQRRVLYTYSADAQAMIHMEECAELIQTVSKMRRAGSAGKTEPLDNLIEEVADVLICIEQMKEMYSFSDREIQEIVLAKCRRQEERLRNAGKGGAV